jgi:hypothetical protein
MSVENKKAIGSDQTTVCMSIEVLNPLVPN